MAVAWGASSHANEWVYWPDRETVTHREQTAIGTYSNHALAMTHPVSGSSTSSVAKRRALTFREAATSAGAYTSANLVFLVPTAAFGATPPKVGDILRDASSIDHTILEVQKGKLGNTQRCVTIALALVNDLRTSAVLLRPTNNQDAAGKRDPDLTAVVENILCRVQPIRGDVSEDGFDGQVLRGRYFAYLDTRVHPRFGDVFVVLNDDDTETRYTITAWENPERLDQLMSLALADLTEEASEITLSANVTITGNGTTTLAASGSASSNVTDYAWSLAQTLSGFPGGSNYSLNGASFAGNWSGTNPGVATVVSPTSLDFGNVVGNAAPLGGYTLTLTGGTPAGSSDTDAKHLLVVANIGNATTFTTGTQGAAITGNVTASTVTTGGGDNQIEITGLTVPTNAFRSVVVVLLNGDTYTAAATSAAGTVTFTGIAAGTYSVYGYGVNFGRNGPAVLLASGVEVTDP